jgi:cell division initiation protein
MLTPVDLETTVFRRGVRGYNTHEVQDFMTRVTHDYEFLYRDNIQLKERIDVLETKLGQYQVMEENLRNTLILAQQNATEIRSVAEAQAITIVKGASVEGEAIKARINGEIQAELQSLSNLKSHIEFFRAQFKHFLTALIEATERQLDLDELWNRIIRDLPFSQAKPVTPAAPHQSSPADLVAPEAEEAVVPAGAVETTPDPATEQPELKLGYDPDAE